MDPADWTALEVAGTKQEWAHLVDQFAHLSVGISSASWAAAFGLATLWTDSVPAVSGGRPAGRRVVPGSAAVHATGGCCWGTRSAGGDSWPACSIWYSESTAIKNWDHSNCPCCLGSECQSTSKSQPFRLLIHYVCSTDSIFAIVLDDQRTELSHFLNLMIHYRSHQLLGQGQFYILNNIMYK